MVKTSDFSIRYYGHPDLRKKALPIEEITPEIVEISKNMITKMLSVDNCIGFSGPQLGIPLRIFVIREEKCLSDNKYSFGEPEVIINKVLSRPSGELETLAEVCMSLPGLQVELTRPKWIHVSYQNLKGEWIEEDLQDFRARMFMHENDHLNGVLYIDRMDSKKRKGIEPVLREMKQKYRI